jgi:hypothetical protein
MADPDQAIPDESRRIVEEREQMRCARCNGRGSEWHHRRSRRVRASHRHCACNGTLLCATDHRWAHANPEAARAEGFIVQQWEDEPMNVPQRRPDGWWVLVCNGDMKDVTEADIITDGYGGYVLAQDAFDRLFRST